MSLSSLSKISAGDVVCLFLYLRESVSATFLNGSGLGFYWNSRSPILSIPQDEALQLSIKACRFLVYFGEINEECKWSSFKPHYNPKRIKIILPLLEIRNGSGFRADAFCKFFDENLKANDKILLWFFIKVSLPKVFTIKSLGLCSGVVEFSVLLGGGAATVGDWRPKKFEAKQCLKS